MLVYVCAPIFSCSVEGKVNSRNYGGLQHFVPETNF